MPQLPNRTPTDRLSPTRLISISASLALLAGCGSGGTVPTPVVPTSQINDYFALFTEPATTSTLARAQSYTFNINRLAGEFDQNDPTPVPISRGPYTTTNGFLDVTLNPYNGQVLQSPEVGNWIVEKASVMGFAYISAPQSTGFTKLASGMQGQNDTSQNVIPFISNAACPLITTKQTYQYLTVPGGNGSQWNYLTQVAYGSADIMTDAAGAVVNFTNLQQYLLPGPRIAGSPVAAGTAVTVNPGPVSTSGSCGNNPAGSLISIVTSVPVATGAQPKQALASVNLASGFLLEYNTSLSQGDPNIDAISNVLGAGYGSVGLLQPSSQVSVSGLTSESFQGFIFEPGGYTSTAAFGSGAGGTASCSTLQAALAFAPNPPSANTVFGGEYAGNDPASNPASNCDVAIDLGTQDSKSNGLFTGATIYIGPSFPLNNPQSSNNAAMGKLYSFPAVAIVGQVDGKDAIFIIGQDTVTNRSVSFYLLNPS